MEKMGKKRSLVRIQRFIFVSIPSSHVHYEPGTRSLIQWKLDMKRSDNNKISDI